MKKSEIYLPGLNGLRAIAAIIVLCHHMLEGLSRFGIREPAFLKIVFGDSSSRNAVNIFFVISGFLITYLLLIENKTKGNIDVRKFYIRRLLRIWPLYFVYLFIVITLSYLMHYTSVMHFFPYYFFFAGNITQSLKTINSFFLINHYWSLGVEEQFYLFWPLAIKFLKKSHFKKFFITAIVLAAFQFFKSDNRTIDFIIRIFVVSRFQCMIIGGLGAIIYFQKPAVLGFTFNKWVQLAAITTIILLLTGQLGKWFLQDELMGLLILIVIIALVSDRITFLKLENRFVNFLGKISFGIYVLHPLAIWAILRVLKHSSLEPEILIWLVCFSTVILTILLAHLSYQYLELKFLRLKHRFSVVSTSNMPAKTQVTPVPSSAQINCLEQA